MRRTRFLILIRWRSVPSSLRIRFRAGCVHCLSIMRCPFLCCQLLLLLYLVFSKKAIRTPIFIHSSPCDSKGNTNPFGMHPSAHLLCSSFALESSAKPRSASVLPPQPDKKLPPDMSGGSLAKLRIHSSPVPAHPFARPERPTPRTQPLCVMVVPLSGQKLRSQFGGVFPGTAFLFILFFLFLLLLLFLILFG